MADEMATAEETAIDNVEEQTTAVEDNGSEADKNSSDDADRGDLRVPLKEERTKRQEYEAKWNDPEQIISRARELGIVAEDKVEETQTQYDQPDDEISQRVAYEIDKAKTLEKYPELQNNVELQYMVTGLINKGMMPSKAAAKVFDNIKKMAEGLSKQEQEEAKITAEAQNKARSVEPTTTTTSSDAEWERIVRDSKSLDPSIQKKAMIEKIKYQMNRGQ